MLVGELDIGEEGVFIVEQELRSVSSNAGKECAVFGDTQKWCMSVFNNVFACAFFEVGVYVGCGFALVLGDESVGPCPGADRDIWARVVGRVGLVDICDLVG
jgi:hypothetical protein